jgi:hypothetical protein
MDPGDVLGLIVIAAGSAAFLLRKSLTTFARAFDRIEISRSAAKLRAQLLARLRAKGNVQTIKDGVQFVEQGFDVTIRFDSSPSWHCSVAVPPPGAPGFVVQCHGRDSELIRAIDRSVSTLLKGWISRRRYLLADVTLRGDATRVALRRAAVRQLGPIERLEEDIGLAIELASIDFLGLATLERLPDATLWRGSEPYVVIAGPGDIRVGLRRAGDQFVTYATCAAPPVDEADLHVDELGAILEPGARATIVWPAIETDARRLNDAITLLRSFTQGPSVGAFR